MATNQHSESRHGASRHDETQPVSVQTHPEQPRTKQQIRSAVRASRAARSNESLLQSRNQLTEQIASLVTQSNAHAVSCYLPVPGEPDTTGFIEWTRSHSVEVLLPVSQENRTLEWARLSEAGTATGRHGIQEPLGERLPAEILSQLDMLIIPACAVDERGMRLGWGLGYYDRLLASLDVLPPVLAVINDDELLAHIPADAHDIPVNGIITPSQTRLFSNNPG